MTDSKKDPVIGTLTRSTSYLDFHEEETDIINSKELNKLNEINPIWRRVFLWDYNRKRIRNSYVIMGAFLILLTSLFLLLLPFIGIVPNTVTMNKNIQSNGQQTLNTLNPMYFSTKKLSINDTANFNIQSTNDIAFGIFNKPIDQLAITNKRNIGSFNSSFYYSGDIAETIPVFLFKGDSVNLLFNITTPQSTTRIGNGVETSYYSPSFEIDSQLNGSDGTPQFIYHDFKITTGAQNDVSFTAPFSDTWNFVWYANGGTGQGNQILNYNISTIDFAHNLFQLNNNSSIQTSFTTPQNGIYSFVVYYNQSNLNHLTRVSYNNSFHLVIKELNPIFSPAPLIILLMTIIIIISFIQKISYKMIIGEVNQRGRSKKQMLNSEHLAIQLFCTICGTQNSKSDTFCSNCGTKLRTGNVQIKNENNTYSTRCSNCGNFLDETSNYCDTCGTKKS